MKSQYPVHITLKQKQKTYDSHVSTSPPHDAVDITIADSHDAFTWMELAKGMPISTKDWSIIFVHIFTKFKAISRFMYNSP